MDPVLRHQRNVAKLDGRGIAVASYPGAGAALLGNIFLELGLDYVDPYTEDLDEDGVARPAPDRLEYRRRLAASAHRDERLRPPGTLRLIKTHLLPQDFPELRGLLLLVRDPRDTLFSYYNWRLAFSEEGENRDFHGFLSSSFPLGLRPVDDWTRFYRLWMSALEEFAGKVALVRFERLKSEPDAEVCRVLNAFGLPISRANVISAVKASTFDSMRLHEDRNASGPSRIMRRGMHGEWVEWYTEETAKYFSDTSFRLLAHRLGYDL